jgi:hypothetical protein
MRRDHLSTLVWSHAPTQSVRRPPDTAPF